MNTTRRAFLQGSGLAVALTLAWVASSALPTRAMAQDDHGSGGHSGGSGGHSGGSGGSGGHGSGHSGPDPNCAFQDRTGRGGFGPQARRGRSGAGGGHGGGDEGGGHDGGHTSEGDHASGGVHVADAGGRVATDAGGGIIGGGAGGEGFVCDGPGSWSVEAKVLGR